MAGGANYYYNPQYADAAKELALAIRGKQESPEDMARSDLYRAQTARQYQENQAIQSYADTIRSGDDPNIIAAEAAAKLNPRNFQPSILSSRGAQISIDQGEPADDVYARQAIISGGGSPSKDFAATPSRADAIRGQEYEADLTKAQSVARIHNEKPGAAGKPVKVSSKDAEQFLIDALSGVPGATVRNKVSSQYGDRYTNLFVPEDVRDTLATNGLLDKAMEAGAAAYRDSGGDSVAARQAVMDAFHFPQGTHFRPAQQGSERSFMHPFTPTREGYAADFLGPNDQSVLTGGQPPLPGPPGPAPGAAPPVQSMPNNGGTLQNPVMVNSPAEAQALPSGTVFAVRGRPDLKPKVRP